MLVLPSESGQGSNKSNVETIIGHHLTTNCSCLDMSFGVATNTIRIKELKLRE